MDKATALAAARRELALASTPEEIVRARQKIAQIEAAG